VFGPGLVVMLADSDVGSVVTAGQSGAQFGYRLLPLQFLLIPLLYMIQELTVRLGIFAGRGHGALLRELIGPRWSWLAAAGLTVSCAGALLTEFSGVAGVGELFGVSRSVTLPLAVAALLGVFLTGSYRRVERAAIAIGLFELCFLGVAWAARPDFSVIAAQSAAIPWRDSGYDYLLAANIGAVIMPWMVFYQQSAVAGRRPRAEHYAAARWDTAIGAVITQLVMAAVLVAAAATVGTRSPGASLTSVGDLSRALAPLLGAQGGRIAFALGVLGAGLVAAIVASLALGWGVAELAGSRRQGGAPGAREPWVAATRAVAVIGGAAAIWAAPDLVALNVGTQVMNAVMLPLISVSLIVLARRAPTPAHRLRGWYLLLVSCVAAVTCALGVWGGIAGALG